MSEDDFNPNDEDYHKVSLDFLKESLEDWLDHNIDNIYERGEQEPEFQLKREEKTLYLKVTEEGGRDNENDGSNYYMILESLTDESEMNKEIETE